jgi:hypothetical protein
VKDLYSHSLLAFLFLALSISVVHSVGWFGLVYIPLFFSSLSFILLYDMMVSEHDRSSFSFDMISGLRWPVEGVAPSLPLVRCAGLRIASWWDCSYLNRKAI